MVIDLLGSSIMAIRSRVPMNFTMVRSTSEHFNNKWCLERVNSSFQMEILIKAIFDPTLAAVEDYILQGNQIDWGSNVLQANTWMVSVKVKEQCILRMVINWLDIGEKEFLRADSNDDMNFYLIRNCRSDFINFYTFMRI